MPTFEQLAAAGRLAKTARPSASAPTALEEPGQPFSLVDAAKGVGAFGLNALGVVGNVLDLPGSVVRDVIGSATSGKWNNPLDQFLSPFTDENRVTGRSILENLGMRKNRETGLPGWGRDPGEGLRDLAGFTLEVLLDPFGSAGKALKAPQAISFATNATGRTVAKAISLVPGGGAALSAGTDALGAARRLRRKYFDPKVGTSFDPQSQELLSDMHGAVKQRVQGSLQAAGDISQKAEDIGWSVRAEMPDAMEKRGAIMRYLTRADARTKSPVLEDDLVDSVNGSFGDPLRVQKIILGKDDQYHALIDFNGSPQLLPVNSLKVVGDSLQSVPAELHPMLDNLQKTTQEMLALQQEAAVKIGKYTDETGQLYTPQFMGDAQQLAMLIQTSGLRGRHKSVALRVAAENPAARDPLFGGMQGTVQGKAGFAEIAKNPIWDQKIQSFRDANSAFLPKDRIKEFDGQALMVLPGHVGFRHIEPFADSIGLEPLDMWRQLGLDPEQAWAKSDEVESALTRMRDTLNQEARTQGPTAGGRPGVYFGKQIFRDLVGGKNTAVPLADPKNLQAGLIVPHGQTPTVITNASEHLTNLAKSYAADPEISKRLHAAAAENWDGKPLYEWFVDGERRIFTPELHSAIAEQFNARLGKLKKSALESPVHESEAIANTYQAVFKHQFSHLVNEKMAYFDKEGLLNFIDNTPGPTAGSMQKMSMSEFQAAQSQLEKAKAAMTAPFGANRDAFRQGLKSVGYADDHADAVTAVVEAQARAFAVDAGTNPDDYFSKILLQNSTPEQVAADALKQDPSQYVAEPFYSKIMEAVDAGKVPARVGRDQLEKTLLGYGVKQEELVDMKSHLDDLFAGAKDGKVSKDEIFDVAAERAWNETSVKVLKGDGSSTTLQDLERLINESEQQTRNLETQLSQARSAGDVGRVEAIIEQMDSQSVHYENITSQYDNLSMVTDKDAPKFAEFQVPGGEPGTYREILVRNPAARGLDDKHFGSVGDVMAHIRADDIKLPDGSTAFRIQEIQSDLHQRGRDNGYLKSLEPLRLELRSAEDTLADFTDGLRKADRNFEAAMGYYQSPQYRHLKDLENKRDLAEKALEAAVPDAPFKKSWPELAAKVAIRQAVESGNDKIALVRGADIAKAVGGPPDALGKFYDEKMTNIISKMVKKAGGTVEEIDPLDLPADLVMTGSTMNKRGDILKDGIFLSKHYPEVEVRVQFAPSAADDAPMWTARIDSQAGETLLSKSYLPSVEEAKAWAEKQIPAMQNQGKKMTVFNLSPKMREEVLGKGQTLYQNAKGAVSFQEDGKAIVSFFQSKDVSTAIHEIAGHVARRNLPPNLMTMAEKAFGVKPGKVWTRPQEEAFATGWERYVREGKAPTKALEGVFAKFSAWLKNIYKSLIGTPLEKTISPEMKDLFDRMVTPTLPDNFAAKVEAGNFTQRTMNRHEGLAELLRDRENFREFGGFANNPLVDHYEGMVRAAHGVETARLLQKFVGNTVANDIASKQASQMFSQVRKVGESGVGVRVSEMLDQMPGIEQDQFLKNIHKDLVKQNIYAGELTDGMRSQIKETLLDPTVMKELQDAFKLQTEDPTMGGILRTYDSLSNVMKSGLLATPSRIARDTLSSTAMAWMKGLIGTSKNDVMHVKRGIQLMRGKRIDWAPDTEEIRALVSKAGGDPNSVEERLRVFKSLWMSRAGGANLHDVARGDALALETSGQADRFLDNMPGSRGEGLLARIKRDASGQTMGQQVNPFNVAGTWVKDASDRYVQRSTNNIVANISNNTSHVMDRGLKLGVLMSVLEKGGPGAKFDDAYKQVADALLNYQSADFSQFEKNVMKRLFPFYGFMSRSVAMVAGELASNPGGRLAQTIRAQRMGQDSEGYTPYDIQDTTAVPLGKDAEGSLKYLTGFGLMHEDAMQYLAPTQGVRGLGQKILGSMNPLLKTGIEYSLNTSTFFEGPMGGRRLDDLDPMLGRLRQLIGEKIGALDPLKKGQTPAPVGGGLGEALVASSPAAAWLRMARTGLDPRKSALERAANIFTGVRTKSYSPEAQLREYRDRLNALEVELGARPLTLVTGSKRLEAEAREAGDSIKADRLAAVRAVIDRLRKEANQPN